MIRKETSHRIKLSFPLRSGEGLAIEVILSGNETTDAEIEALLLEMDRAGTAFLKKAGQ